MEKNFWKNRKKILGKIVKNFRKNAKKISGKIEKIFG